MAKFVATDYSVTVNGTAFGSSLQSVELSIEADEQETTGFGTSWRERVAGLRTGSVTLNFYQDFAAGALDAVVWPLLGSNATVVIKPTSTATSATNPAYSAICLVNSYSPFASSVGDIATTSVTWPTTGTVTRATA